MLRHVHFPEFRDMNAPRFTQRRHTFSMVCRVEVEIRTVPGRVWTLLTDAEAFPRWNSTVTHIEGEIREGERLRIHVPGTTRTFTPTVSHFAASEHMTWSGGLSPLFKGVRTFQLRPIGVAATLFSMEERFSGLIFALLKGTMPDFDPIFRRYASDLKQEAER